MTSCCRSALPPCAMPAFCRFPLLTHTPAPLCRAAVAFLGAPWGARPCDDRLCYRGVWRTAGALAIAGSLDAAGDTASCACVAPTCPHCIVIGRVSRGLLPTLFSLWRIAPLLLCLSCAFCCGLAPRCCPLVRRASASVVPRASAWAASCSACSVWAFLCAPLCSW